MSGASPYRTSVQQLGNGFAKVADLDFTVATYFLVPTDGRNSASIHLRFTGSAARSTAVATVIASNDPNLADYADHPATLTLGSSTATPVFDAGYGYIGLRVSTTESGVHAEVYLRFGP